ncbi:hypothetical protein JB92DRAFT_970832 [Gautieria morchelliformis]|nr:hypothetical protein JB92DRAFT_970832 [Gautieria morchelliformis]
MKRVRDASGAKYSVHNEATRSAEPIAPVGTNYTPVVVKCPLNLLLHHGMMMVPLLLCRPRQQLRVQPLRLEHGLRPPGPHHHLPNLPRRIVSCLSRLLILRNASVAQEPPVSSEKLTWSERQALAKKQQAEEEARFEAASVTTATAVDVNRVGSVAAAAAAGRQACQRGGQAVE